VDGRHTTRLRTLLDFKHEAAMFTIRQSRADEGHRTVSIWRAAVDATHDFLTDEDRVAIEGEVCAFLPQAPLLLAVDHDDRPLGFMLMDGKHMEALFVDPAYHGRGIGAELVRRGLAMHPDMTTDVNEQNGQAIAFYERLGFRRTGRSLQDAQGRPYPLIHLAHRG
jgi:putative acetyltransferase